jgi:serine/threonine protein phosphatase PrpC
MKENNLSLITNNTLKDIIIKFREERKKENDERKSLFRNKSMHDYEYEKKNNFLMLKALMRKDPQTIQTLINRNNKINNKINRHSPSKNNSLLADNRNKSLLLGRTMKKSSSEKMHNNSSLSQNSKRAIWKKDFFAKEVNGKKKLISKKYELKIKSSYSQTTVGKISSYKVSNLNNKKFNQDISFSLLNISSVKLGEISLFGVLDGNGPYGKQVSSIVKDYIVDYFTNCTEMKVTLKRDNFYSIMYNSFVFAQKYLVNNNSKLNLNLDYSGVTGCILLYPQNGTNKIYCANLGRSKCVLYTMFGTIKLSYELYPERASEKYRISLLNNQNEASLFDFKEIEESKNINQINENNNNNININGNNINISSNNINNNNENEKDKDKEKINLKLFIQKNKNLPNDDNLKDFLELDISRCVGNLIGNSYGVIPGPEVIESDIRLNRGKFIVMGTSSLWKYLNEDEVGNIVNKYLSTNDSIGACKTLEEAAKERWKIDTGGYDDISVIVIFFDLKN